MSRVLPILFNGDMVRAILDGRKTVTRRVIKPQPKMKLCYTFAGGCKKDIGKWGYPSNTAHEYWGEEYKHSNSLTEDDLKMKWNPPYHTDDILYVRETFGFQKCSSCEQCADCVRIGFEDEYKGEPGCYVYRTNYGSTEDDSFPTSMHKWHPSIHMPKEAARIWLKVTYVRVERLQEITWQQAAKEGCQGACTESLIPVDPAQIPTLRGEFKKLWNSTIKNQTFDRYGWDANPWVWVIEFERCEKPEEV